MSNHLAIATVTETLRYMLDAAVKKDVAGAEAKTARLVSSGANLPGIGVNIYLYSATPNQTWRNSELPTTSSDGAAIRRPRAAVDLHYLLSFYGDDILLEPQRVMGSVVKALQTNPILTRKKVREVIDAAKASDPNHYLKNANLDEEVELVKFTPRNLSLEDLARLWSMFVQTSYTLSTAYSASVVFIEADTKPQTGPPVRVRNVYAMPFRDPRLKEVYPSTGEDEQVISGDTLVLEGERLISEVTRIRFTSIEPLSTPTSERDDELRVALPAALRAGIHGVQVVHLINIGTPPTLHRGVESNVLPFVLHPQITAAVGAITTTVVNGVSLRSTDLTVNFTPPIREGQKVRVLLNEFQPAPTAAPANAYSFNAPDWNAISVPASGEVGAIVFPITQILPGNYLVRVQVDGGESLMTTDVNGRFDAPQVAIP